MDFMALLMREEKSNQSFFRARKKKHFDFYHHENRWIEDVRKVPGKQIDISSIFKQTDITNFPLQIHNFLTKCELFKKCEFKAFLTHHMFKEMLS